MKPTVKVILSTGLLVGVADILAATISSWIQAGTFPSKILHYIAGGALGLEKSMTGGIGTALLGLLFHFFIAMSWTSFFFLMFPKLNFLHRFNKYVVGFLYGAFVGSVMTFIILPLSALPNNPFNLTRAIVGWSILGIALGIPIAFSAYKYYNLKPRAGSQIA